MTSSEAMAAAAAAAGAPPAGAARYEKEAKVGEGTYAIVYRARDRYSSVYASRSVRDTVQALTDRSPSPCPRLRAGPVAA